jgi:putative ABC transport system permease protein
MNGRDRIWILVARKWAGEATEEELKELEQWQRQHPDDVYTLQILADLLKTQRPTDKTAAEQAFDEHMLRLEEHSARAQQPAARTPHPPAASAQEPSARPPEYSARPWNTTTRTRHTDILRNYMLVAWRSFSRNKIFSALNVSGLAIGIASAVLLLLWIWNEVSTDRFHANGDRIYGVMTRSLINGRIECWGATPMVLGPALQSAYPQQIEQVVRTNWVGAFILSSGDQHLQTYGYLTDPGFLTMFSFPLIQGDALTALSSPHSIVLTAHTATRLFGTTNALGQDLRIDSNAIFKVTGILADLPSNTQLQFDYLVPWSYTKEVNWEDHSWASTHISTMVMLRRGVTETAADSSIRNIVRANDPSVNNDIFLHPIRKWKLWSEFENGKIVGGEIRFIRLLILVAVFILLIACINYMNLGTARSIRRAKEVGIRKMIGAGKGSLVGRFIGESVLTAFLAGLIALAIVQLTLSWFNRMVDSNLSIPYLHPLFWLLAIGFLLFTGLLAGSYPAFYLSAYNAVQVLKGNFKIVNGMIGPRKILVVLQFTFAIAFIICTIVIYKQISFVRHRDIGYNQDHLVFTWMKGDVKKRFEDIRGELLSSGAATSVIRTNSPVTDIWAVSDDYAWSGKKTGARNSFIEFYSDHGFVSTLGLRLMAGREIDIRRYPSDSSAIVLTESALKLMGFSRPLGQQIHNLDRDWHVVGVIHDFVTGTPFYPISPVVIKGPIAQSGNYWFGTVTCKLNDRLSINESTEKMTAIFKKYNPDYPFEYHFIDDFYAEKFDSQKKAGSLAAWFAGLSIFISCLGLFGLAAYTAENRIKEVGIRKVLGASILQIASLLSKDFLILILVAFAIAAPIAWWYMNYWLSDYPYRVGITWWIYALAGALTALIAAGTIGIQAVRAAMTRPVDTLRTE